jgi:hypothetical protein
MLIQSIRKLAADYPDVCYPDTYTNCKYTTGLAGPGEGCIVGQGLLAAFPHHLEALKDLDDRGFFGPESLLNACQLNYNRTDIQWLETVQMHQDKGTSWRESVALADERLGLI